MKNNFLQLAFGGIVLILGAGLEELLPKFFGVGFPFLLSAVPFLASRRSPVAIGLALVVSAGAFEDALSGLPLMTSVSYFLILAVFCRRLDLPWTGVLLAYPCYQLWLVIWSGLPQGELFIRFLLSLPVGAVTALLTGVIIVRIREGAALDEQD